MLQKPLREKAILALLIGAAAEKIEEQIAGSVARRTRRHARTRRRDRVARGTARRRCAAGAGVREFRSVPEL